MQESFVCHRCYDKDQGIWQPVVLYRIRTLWDPGEPDLSPPRDEGQRSHCGQ